MRSNTAESAKPKNPQERKLWERCILAQLGNPAVCLKAETIADAAVLCYRERRGQLDLDGKFRVATR